METNDSERWVECDWVGTIVKHPLDNERRPNNLDDYDERKKGESQWKDLQ